MEMTTSSVCLRWGVCALALWLSAPLEGFGQGAADNVATAPATRPALKTIDYQPGVRIDWTRRQIEVAGTVILRQGLLELFACSPRTREHESIVRLEARPLHVYQALGLIGLVPGHPTGFDPRTGLLEPASGDPVELEVRYSSGGAARSEPIENWLRLTGPEGSRQRLGRLGWIFAGSLPAENGGIAADAEGTVVALVDFDSALIALPEYHTDSNAALWLEPNTQAIPPLRTPCTLIIRPGPVRVSLDAAGRLRLNGHASTLAGVAAAIQEAAPQRLNRPVAVTLDPQAPPAGEHLLRELMADLQFPPDRIVFHASTTITAVPHEPDTLTNWINRQLSPARIDQRGDGHRPNPMEAHRPGWTEPIRQQAQDLQAYALRLQARTTGLARLIEELVRDLRGVLVEPTAPTRDRSHAD